MKNLVLALSLIALTTQSTAKAESSEGDFGNPSLDSSVNMSCSSGDELACSRDTLLNSDAIVQAALSGQITAEEAAELLAKNAQALRRLKK